MIRNLAVADGRYASIGNYGVARRTTKQADERHPGWSARPWSRPARRRSGRPSPTRTASRSGWRRRWSSIPSRAARSQSATARTSEHGTVETFEENERFAFTWSAARRGRELRRVHDRGAARRQPGDRRRDPDRFGGHKHRRRTYRDGDRWLGARARRASAARCSSHRRLRAPAHRHVDSVFGALADPTRRRVVETLARGGTVTASGLAGQLPMTRQAVAKHLSALHGAELVSASGSAGRRTTSSARSRSTRRRTGSRW